MRLRQRPLSLIITGMALVDTDYGATRNLSSLNGVAVVLGQRRMGGKRLCACEQPGSGTLVEHWNGTAWTQFVSPNFGSYSNYLHAVSAISDHMWAVGTKDSGNNAHTLAMRWNWHKLDPGQPPKSSSYMRISSGGWPYLPQ